MNACQLVRLKPLAVIFYILTVITCSRCISSAALCPPGLYWDPGQGLCLRCPDQPPDSSSPRSGQDRRLYDAYCVTYENCCTLAASLATTLNETAPTEQTSMCQTHGQTDVSDVTDTPKTSGVPQTHQTRRVPHYSTVDGFPWKIIGPIVAVCLLIALAIVIAVLHRNQQRRLLPCLRLQRSDAVHYRPAPTDDVPPGNSNQGDDNSEANRTVGPQNQSQAADVLINMHSHDGAQSTPYALDMDSESANQEANRRQPEPENQEASGTYEDIP